ncbi:sensor histidine kinase [Luteirhabdus pelagi]|uniref:sensor histidine kinase n=1 Tax=Luteirhabdus pelagi TaxID=2792783 RepID=UPI00193A3C0B|nr:sensor histidine kinase [Luteirhabdus pelagi]
MRYWIFPILTLLFLNGHVWGQQTSYRFQRYGINEGLSQVSLRDLEIDKDGHVWIASDNGVNRFNGSSFMSFQQPIDTTEIGLIFNEVGHILEDSDSVIWMGTRQGLSRYDPKTETFTNFKETGNCANCIIHPAISFLKEYDDFIYIGTVGGLSRIHKTSYQIDSWPYVEGKVNGPKRTAIREMDILDDGRLLILSQVGISLFNPKNETFTHITTTDGLPEDKLQSIYRDSNNTYWIGCETKGLLKLTGSWDSPSFKHYPPILGEGPSHGFIYEITEDDSGMLWMATFNGVTLFNPKTETFEYLFHNPEDEASLSSNQVFDIEKDAHNRMWLSTISGLNVYDPYLNQFQLMTSKQGEGKSLASDKTFSVFEDSKGFLWVGNYENGLTVLPPKGSEKEFLHIQHGEGNKNLSSPQVLGIEEDDNGRIWLATFNGINIIDWPDRATDDFNISQLDLSAIPNNPHLSRYNYFVKKDSDGVMWVGTHGAGLLRIEEDESVRQFSFNEKPTGITENIILSMKIDEKGRIWLGTTVLGFAMVEDEENQDHFKRIPGNSIISQHGVHGIYTKGEKELIMTTGAGIFHFYDKEELFKNTDVRYSRYTKKDGLSDNITYALVKTDSVHYWISTGNGLTRWNTKTNTFTPYTTIFGNNKMDFNQGAACLSGNGRLYFGSSGVLSFNPETIYANAVAPKVYFEDLRILNVPVPISESKEKEFTLPTSLRFQQKLTLKPKHKIFSIKIANVNHTLPTETHYAYKLDGFDEQWTYTKDPLITRSNLDPGNYKLIAKAANNDGVWSAPISLAIEILPPWYRSWWAYLLFLLFGIGFVYFLLKLRVLQERRVALARAQERDMFRKRSSRDFHDEAGTRITRIALITELAKLESQSNEKLEEYLSQIEGNLQELNNGMRDFIWTLDPSKDNAFDTLNRFTEFASSFCECAGIQFKSDPISEKLKTKELNMSERRHVLLILKEALNNSVKHAKPSVIRFQVTSKPGLLGVTLTDNGSGFATEKNTNGNGLKNMKERADALGGTLDISSSKEGTSLKLVLQTTRLGN